MASSRYSVKYFYESVDNVTAHSGLNCHSVEVKVSKRRTSTLWSTGKRSNGKHSEGGCFSITKIFKKYLRECPGHSLN
ncbi:hypothetical protein T05_16354 [Trichinella murrelli]|uniref:Uncharacterized protein n=1 Tax=Trichinella murrelli TaxID=144512 RepID=A0A0V0UF68_9BILA|nr:hypothetical protein T05_16354 [Trichinella murrelli]